MLDLSSALESNPKLVPVFEKLVELVEMDRAATNEDIKQLVLLLKVVLKLESGKALRTSTDRDRYISPEKHASPEFQ